MFDLSSLRLISQEAYTKYSTNESLDSHYDGINKLSRKVVDEVASGLLLLQDQDGKLIAAPIKPYEKARRCALGLLQDEKIDYKEYIDRVKAEVESEELNKQLTELLEDKETNDRYTEYKRVRDKAVHKYTHPALAAMCEQIQTDSMKDYNRPGRIKSTEDLLKRNKYFSKHLFI